MFFSRLVVKFSTKHKILWKVCAVGDGACDVPRWIRTITCGRQIAAPTGSIEGWHEIVGANCVRPRAVTDRPYGFYPARVGTHNPTA